jgi:hypothetical protein
MIAQRSAALAPIRRLATLFGLRALSNWVLIPCILWFLAGLYLDGWAHNHGKVDNTFFTPWHAVFYSGYMAIAGMLAVIVIMSVLRGETWQIELPSAYRQAILAAPLFALGGVADLWWHTTFGFETGIEPLLSPPHLVLAGSMFFMSLAVARSEVILDRWSTQIPVTLSLLAAWSVVTFILQFNHPYGIVWPERGSLGQGNVVFGLLGIVLHSLFACVVGLWMLQRNFRRGLFTLVLVANTLLIALMGDEYRFGWVALGAGVISEAIDVLLRGRTLMVRQLARVTSVGLTLTTLYFVVIAQSSVLYWSLSDCMSASILTTMVCMSTVALMRATTPATA